ncbi:MAG: hypothetical protein ACJAWV_000429 [Flammeovirgaceae bacterium]|jgi:hypothetical protein
MKSNILMAVFALFLAQSAFAQEADDMYFFTSDRKEVKQDLPTDTQIIFDESLVLPEFKNPHGDILEDDVEGLSDNMNQNFYYNPYSLNFNHSFHDDITRRRGNWEVNSFYSSHSFYGTNPFHRFPGYSWGRFIEPYMYYEFKGIGALGVVGGGIGGGGVAPRLFNNGFIDNLGWMRGSSNRGFVRAGDIWQAGGNSASYYCPSPSFNRGNPRTNRTVNTNSVSGNTSSLRDYATRSSTSSVSRSGRFSSNRTYSNSSSNIRTARYGTTRSGNSTSRYSTGRTRTSSLSTGGSTRTRSTSLSTGSRSSSSSSGTRSSTSGGSRKR